LSVDELAAHAHDFTGPASLVHNSAGGAQPMVQSLMSRTTVAVGGSQPHNNIQAALGINFIIKT